VHSPRRERADSGGVQAVDRAMEVLAALAEEGAQSSLQQLSERLGVAPSTIHRILTTLERTGMVERAVGGGYLPGPKIADLYHARAQGTDLRARALPYLHELRQLTEETVSLHVRRHAQQVCLESLDSPHELCIRLVVGSATPLCDGSTGRVILAHLPVDEARRILLEACAPGGANREGWVGDRLYELHLVRASGYAIGQNEPQLGMAAVSAPIFDRAADVVGALTVSGPTVRFRRRELLAAADRLRASAARLSAELGHRVPSDALRRRVGQAGPGRIPTP
jgi:IclR family transcriptional regulator, KDG regulon repressor